MDFRPLAEVERKNLFKALNRNVESDYAILMSRKDTSFLGESQEVPDDEVINAVRSVPCHY